MKETWLQRLLILFALVAMFLASTHSIGAQSQALNGQIEGTVSDQNNAAIHKAAVTVTNIETGAARTATTDENGIYRFPLLPLGTYRVTVEAANFKKLVREGITLATGQTKTLDLLLQTGEIGSIVTVSGDGLIADAGKTDLGRVLPTREIQELPLISRNPYNFAFLQANVSGRPARGFPFTTINANGYLRRVNFLLDGNTNTQGDRGSLRFMQMSETYVSEVQLVTNGFAAEFGNTPGLIMNVVTPSGTNKLSGSISYRFRRAAFYSRPFFFPAADLPDNKADNYTAAVGGPILKDRWHFYAGFESQYRDDKAVAARLLTIRPEDRLRLIAAGLPASIFPAAIPALEKGTFYILRTDLQLNNSNRFSARFNHSDVLGKNLIQGMANTLDRSIDSRVADNSLGIQLVSYTSKLLNEFRFQYAHRIGGNERNEFSGDGPSIVINGVNEKANFGSPEGVDTFFLPRRITQIQDNLTRSTAEHIVKVGGGFTFYDHNERASVFSRYTFPSISAYVAARTGANPRSYSFYDETFGDPEVNYKATFWNLFLQDDWKATRRLKFNIGLRYDLYAIPNADPASPFPASRKFNVDKNNFAPRFGAAYGLREGSHPTVFRAGAGIYYDQPLLAMYQRALVNNGNPGFFTFRTVPGPNAPAFPNNFGSLPALPRQNIDTISSDFATMYAIHSHVQIEQTITYDMSVAIGFIRSAGRNIPIYRNINPINPGTFLADGRPVFSTAVNAATRLDPRFNNILMVESVGVSEYNALTIQANKRFSRDMQFSMNYTLSKATDDSPEQNMTTGAIQGLVLSDPTNRAFDKGASFADQRHTFVMSLIAHPRPEFANKLLRYIFSRNVFGIIATANSGEAFNIISNSDLNRDGVSTSDRPVGISRNSGTTPPQFDVDMRYSRFFIFGERYRLGVSAEFQNLFNTNSIIGFNNVSVSTNPTTGEMIGLLPDFRARNQSTSQDSRQFQLGIKFTF